MHDPTEGFGGVDWAQDGHAVCVVDADGRTVAELDVPHSADGLCEMCRRLAQARARRVAIERPDGPVVAALLDGGFEVADVRARGAEPARSVAGAVLTWAGRAWWEPGPSALPPPGAPHRSEPRGETTSTVG